jgi:phage/plasmid-associated DNA primase
MISSEGADKGTLMKLFAKMLGKKKILETSTPSRDVWGSFNSLMGDYFLINLNELSKSETKGNEGQLKAMITDGTIVINSKGIAQYEIDSYHRFFITTNNPDPITTKKDDRRNVIIRSSDEKIGDKNYFEEINDYLDDDDIIKCVYEYFKSIPNMESFGSIPIPVTDYQSNLKEGNREMIDLWLQDFILENVYQEKVEKTTVELFNLFLVWCENKSIIYIINQIKFAVKLSNMRIDGISTIHSNNGNKKSFDMNKIKLHYGFTNGVCQIKI